MTGAYEVLNSCGEFEDLYPLSTDWLDGSLVIGPAIDWDARHLSASSLFTGRQEQFGEKIHSCLTKSFIIFHKGFPKMFLMYLFYNLCQIPRKNM